MNQPDPINEHHVPTGEELNPAELQKTPLEQVHEQQSMRQKNLDSSQKTPDVTPQVVGQGAPSDKIHHPQRQLYDGKD
ncbi:hypothetical protein B1R32_10866 [Abditibacterium utsteinense]|uniref:Uncharacterized protein n=1 Tax=Abditibacterium utsteinense TaxID=1960156 RepID=A0A2S8SSZ0_9BACT|nr:hypothetical protein [Abditibacterium utsteinense]PQV63859.1 hypothetical protein B1R32_10866 [Abditibacterium utsteinense]